MIYISNVLDKFKIRANQLFENILSLEILIIWKIALLVVSCVQFLPKFYQIYIKGLFWGNVLDKIKNQGPSNICKRVVPLRKISYIGNGFFLRSQAFKTKKVSFSYCFLIDETCAMWGILELCSFIYPWFTMEYKFWIERWYRIYRKIVLLYKSKCKNQIAIKNFKIWIKTRALFCMLFWQF